MPIQLLLVPKVPLRLGKDPRWILGTIHKKALKLGLIHDP